MRNRDKRIAWLLIASFAWLFIGSLVIFHEEHVLRKHVNMNTQAFLSPKSNDKQGFTIKLVKPLLKLYDNGGAVGILTTNNFSSAIRKAFDIMPGESPSFLPGDIIQNNASLRAPPVA